MNINELYWTDSNIESISASGKILTVEASNVFLGDGDQPRRITVIFSGVSSAKREVNEYIGDRSSNIGFRGPYFVEDVAPADLQGRTDFNIEGITTFDPISWVTINVTAQDVKILEL